MSFSAISACLALCYPALSLIPMGPIRCARVVPLFNNMTATPTLREELQLLASVNNASNLVFHVNTVNSCQHKCGCIIIFFLKSVKKCFASVVSNCVHL